MKSPWLHLTWFRAGNRIAFAALGYAVLTVSVYFTWYYNTPTYLAGQSQARFVSVLESVPSLGAGVLFALLTPKVAMWNALGARRLRTLNTASCLVFMVAIAAIPTLVYAVLAHQPTTNIPGFEEMFAGDPNLQFTENAPLTAYIGWCGNILFFCGLAAACNAMLGPVLGMGLTWLGYLAVLYAQSTTAISDYVPLTSTMKHITAVHIITGCIAAAAGLVIWHTTRASRPVQRRYKLPV